MVQRHEKTGTEPKRKMSEDVLRSLKRKKVVEVMCSQLSDVRTRHGF